MLQALLDKIRTWLRIHLVHNHPLAVRAKLIGRLQDDFFSTFLELPNLLEFQILKFTL